MTITEQTKELEQKKPGKVNLKGLGVLKMEVPWIGEGSWFVTINLLKALMEEKWIRPIVFVKSKNDT